MQKLVLFCLFIISAQAIQVTRYKSHIRENRLRAQLTLTLQVAEIDLVPYGSSYEKELAKLMKQYLLKSLKKQKHLKIKKNFTHIFVTAVHRSGEEPILALLSKTPYDRYPVFNFYKRPEPVYTEQANFGQPVSLEEQLNQL